MFVAILLLLILIVFPPSKGKIPQFYGENGEVIELKCSADLETGGKNPTDGRKIKGTIHWVSKDFAVKSEIRLYDIKYSLTFFCIILRKAHQTAKALSDNDLSSIIRFIINKLFMLFLIVKLLGFNILHF